MKKFVYIVVLVGIGLIIMSVNSIPDSDKNTLFNSKLKTITIFNETDKDFEKLFFSLEDQEKWIEVDFDVEKFNESRKIKIIYEVNPDCYYDIRALDTEYEIFIWKSFDLCNETEVFLYIEEESEEPDTNNIDQIKCMF